MTVEQILTTAEEYTNQYTGDYFDCYQIHIFSFNKILSTYFNPANITIDQLRLNAESIVSEIQKKSERKKQGFLFESNGKFLITESCNLSDEVELFEFNPEFVRYEPCYDYDELYEFLGETRIETFIKNALITVGAEELIAVIEPQINKLIEGQNSSDNYFNKYRELDKTDPKYIIEIYKIEKNYIPVKLTEIQSNDFEGTLYLPENRKTITPENRMTYKVKEIATNKIVENGLGDAIEHIRYMKHLRKNPPIMDLDILQRMELDNDDPDFISYDDYTKIDEDEIEEGDDDYIPRR